jgi:hypothetical protein
MGELIINNLLIDYSVRESIDAYYNIHDFKIRFNLLQADSKISAEISRYERKRRTLRQITL